jgi:hypothetical protein
MAFATLFKPDYERYEGVRPIQIQLGRIGYALVFFTVGYRSWASLLTFRGDWEPIQAAAVAMWASSSLLSVLGIFYPLKMLPLILFEVGYKLIWLAAVAWPLWQAGRLAGSPAEELTYAFLAVVIPIAVVPWGYVIRVYILNRPSPQRAPRIEVS